MHAGCEEIAFEKCGTIKENGNVVCSFGQPDGAIKVIQKTVNEKNNTLTIPCESDVEILKSDIFGTEFTYKNNTYFVKMAGEHQVKNMTCVIEACNVLKKYFEVSDENIKAGISETILPARVEIISKKPLVVLDGGHNEDGAKAFYNAILPELENKSRVVVIAGMMADKAVEDSLKPLMLKTDVFFAVTPDNPRAMKAHDLAEIASKYSKQVFTVGNIKEAVKISYAAADENTAVLVVGSLYLAGEIRETLLEIF